MLSNRASCGIDEGWRGCRARNNYLHRRQRWPQTRVLQAQRLAQRNFFCKVFLRFDSRALATDTTTSAIASEISAAFAACRRPLITVVVVDVDARAGRLAGTAVAGR